MHERRRHTITGDTRMVWKVADYSQGVRSLLGFKDHTEARAEAKRIGEPIAWMKLPML
jgi:hypothetical protein